MITPLDIQNKIFNKAVRGYKEEEVDGFLDQLTVDYERVIDDNESLRSKLADANAKLEEYKATEGTVLETLEAAKALMNDIAASAEKRADILVKNAELDAELKQKQSRESVERLKEEELRLSQRVTAVRAKFKSMLESELERFDVLSEELFGAPEDGSFLEGGGFKKPETLKPLKEEDIFKSDDSRMFKSDDEDMFKTKTNFRSEEI